MTWYRQFPYIHIISKFSYFEALHYYLFSVLNWKIDFPSWTVCIYNFWNRIFKLLFIAGHVNLCILYCCLSDCRFLFKPWHCQFFFWYLSSLFGEETHWLKKKQYTKDDTIKVLDFLPDRSSLIVNIYVVN